MDVNIIKNSDILEYDCKLFGYDGTYWNTISGTPSAASDKVRLNTAVIATYQTLRNCVLQMALNIPTAPTAEDSRVFGFYSPTLTDKGKIVFQISGTALTAEVYDEDGDEIDSKSITWDNGWTATETLFEIVVNERNVIFKIAGTIVARFDDIAVAQFPLNVYLANNNSDNLDIGVIKAW